MVFAAPLETAQEILYGIFGDASSSPVQLGYDAPAPNTSSPVQHDVPELRPPAALNSPAAEPAAEPPPQPPRQSSFQSKQQVLSGYSILLTLALYRSYFTERKATKQTADHEFLEKKWRHEQLLRDKENAIEAKRLDLENSRIALDRERLQQEAALRFEELKAREEDRRDRQEQRRQNSENQAVLLEVLKSVLGQQNKK